MREFNVTGLCSPEENYMVDITNKLKQIKVMIDNAYFKLTKHEHDCGFDYEIDVDKVERARKSKGCFMIFSTDEQATPEDILYYYREKDVAEKMLLLFTPFR